MNKNNLPIISLLILLLVSFNTLADNTIDLHTANNKGDYHAVGLSISRLLQNHKLPTNVHISAGSVDNVDKMLKGEADLALIQSDVLYRVSRKNHADKSKDIGKISSIAALFPEYIQVLVKKQSNINKVLKLSGKKLYIGEKKSGSRANALEILQRYDISETDFKQTSYKEGGLQAAKEALANNDIDAIITTSGNLNTDPRFKLLGFDQSFVKRLIDEKPYYSYKLYEDDFIPKYLVYIRAVLAVRNQDGTSGLSDEVVKKITKTLHQNWFEIEKNVDKNLAFFSKHLIARKVAISLHHSAEMYYVEQGVLANVGGIYIAAFIILAFLITIIAIRHWAMERRWVSWLLKSTLIRSLYQGVTKKMWDTLLSLTTSHGWVMLLWLFVFIVFTDILIINYFEKSYAHQNDVVNPFAGKDIIDILFWLLTFAVTGFNQNIFPNGMIAKVSAVVIPILAVLGAFFIVIHESIQQDRHREKQLRGEVAPHLNDHILICGWNDRVPSIVNNLLSQFAPGHRHKIVIIAEIDEEKPLQKYGLNSQKVFFYRGISSSYKVLEAIGIKNSHSAIIVADDKKVQQGNYRSIFTVSAIRDLTSSKPDYPIIAEVFYQENVNYFDDHKVQRLISLKRYSARFLSHSIVNPGVSDVLLNLLSFEPPYQLAEVEAKEYGIDKKTYQDSVKILREQNILLLGVYQESKKVIHDSIELEFRTDSPYFSNSVAGGNKDTIASNDKLIILKNLKHGSLNQDLTIQKDSFAAIDIAKEVILIIGGYDIAAQLCDQLSSSSKQVLQLKIDQHSSPNDKYLKITESKKFNVYETNDLLHTLNRSNFPLDTVTRILVLGPDQAADNKQNNVYQDDEALKTVTIINHYLTNCFTHNQKSIPHIAAEIRAMDNERLFYNAGAKQLISTNKFIEQIISRMVFHRGKVSGFLVKAMSYDQSNQLVRIEKWSAQKLSSQMGQDLIGHNYDQILVNCLPAGIQLIAIECLTTKGNREIIINPVIKSPESQIGLGSKDNVFLLVSTKIGQVGKIRLNQTTSEQSNEIPLSSKNNNINKTPI